MEQVLFICTGNTCRSAMAEIYFNHKIKSIKDLKFYAESAGIASQDNWPISGGASHALLNNDIPVPEGFHSSALTREILEKSKYVFVMSKMHKDFILENFPDAELKVYLLSEINNEIKDIEDPVGLDDLFFEKIFQIIKNYIDRLIDILKNEETGKTDIFNKNMNFA